MHGPRIMVSLCVWNYLCFFVNQLEIDVRRAPQKNSFLLFLQFSGIDLDSVVWIIVLFSLLVKVLRTISFLLPGRLGEWWNCWGGCCTRSYWRSWRSREVDGEDAFCYNNTWLLFFAPSYFPSTLLFVPLGLNLLFPPMEMPASSMWVIILVEYYTYEVLAVVMP